MRRMRVLAVASSGGHWIQLCRLKVLFSRHDTRYVTTFAGAISPTSTAVIEFEDISRSTPAKIPGLVARMTWLIIKFRPDVVVTTGAAPGLIALWIAKTLGIKTIWIDSMANSRSISLSGRLARNCSDLWLTQWPELANPENNLAFLGRVV